MMLDVFIRTDCLTSETSDHSIIIMRHLCQEFYVNDLISILMKFSGFWKQMVDENLKLLQTYESSGCVKAIHHKNEKKTIKLNSWIIHIDTYTKQI